MDGHAESEEEEDRGVVGEDVGYLGEVPMRPYLLYHARGGVPCHFVGLGGVEVGTRTEKESGEGNEDESDEQHIRA